jgi:aminomethyltransferase
MTSPTEHVYHLALRDLHAAAGAVFHPRRGWMLPAHYGDPAAEYAALREHAVILDRSARSRFIVSGTDAGVVLDAVFAGHIHDLEEGRALRTVALDEEGNIADLLLVARTGGIAYLVVGEPDRRFETKARLEGAVEADYDVRVDDRTESTCLIAVAGPAAEHVAREHLSEGLPARLQTLHNVTFEFHGFRALATRTSDTGEDGFEFMLAPAVAQHIIETLRGAEIMLAGDAVQEVARVEACIPAYSPDLEQGLSPAEADLDVLLGLPGGREGRILSAVLLDREDTVPIGAAVTVGGRTIGRMTSCVRSEGLDATIGLAVIDQHDALPGTEMDVDGSRASVVAKPFYRRRR